MDKPKKVVIIGHFGGNKNFLDGQTVKTKTLYDTLLENSNFKIKKVDTYNRHKNPIKLFVQIIFSLMTTKDVIILVSDNGVRVLFPILYFFAKCFKTRIYHDAIGSKLATCVKEHQQFKKYINSFKVNWVETKNLKNELDLVGINNAEVLPNFKKIEIIKKEELKEDFLYPFEFCTFSRVMKEKGIEDAVKAIEAINKRENKIVCKLDIYGPIDEKQKDWFDALEKSFPEYIKYKGSIHYDRSTEVIKNYYMLLFPTCWRGEGFAGTVIDAFSAGLPVIATDWNCNAEIIDRDINGIIYPSEKISSLEQAIDWALNNISEVKKMKENCIYKAETYKAEKMILNIIKKIEKEQSKA